MSKHHQYSISVLSCFLHWIFPVERSKHYRVAKSELMGPMRSKNMNGVNGEKIFFFSVPSSKCGSGDVYHMRREQRRAVVHKAASHKT